MELVFMPLSPWHWFASGIAILIAILVLVTVLVPSRRRLLGRAVLTRIVNIVLLGVTALALALAVWNPMLVRPQQSERLHFAVVLDSSPSAQRASGGWVQVRTDVADLLRRAIEALPSELREESSASISVFRGEASPILPPPNALNELPERIRNLNPDELSGNESDLAAGLRTAGEQVRAAGGRGAVLLVSDGLQTEGDALEAARVLAQQGIPIFVYPISSEGAEISILAADLPRQTLAGRDMLLRSTLWNSRQQRVDTQISLLLNNGLAENTPRVSASVGVSETLALDADGLRALRAPLAFGGHGLQFVDFALSYDQGQGLQRRRFFTHVKRPLELLSIGGDRRWQSAFPPTVARITEVAPGQLATAGDLRTYDAVIISAVLGSDFAPDELAAISAAVQNDGLGLMLINGDHGGASEQAATVLMSYDTTPIGELLPVNSGPRPFEEQPPSRHVIFLIDASGSMGGWRLDKAKEIAASIIEREMRPTDTVDIIAFTTGALQLVKNQPTTPEHIPGIIQALASIQLGGGTDPTEALQLIANQQFDSCGLIFLSDGGFGANNVRPDCRTTAFAIGGGFPPALAEFADPIAVDPSFNPTSITIPYFEPEKRTRFWEPGNFRAFSTATLSRSLVRLNIPEEHLSGSAISHLRPGAELVAVRPKVIDPVLAYIERGAGYVGVFTSAVPSEWLGQNESMDAVQSWIEQLVPYAARDRYDFWLRDDGVRMQLRVALVATDGQVPGISSMQISLEQPNQPPQMLTVRPDPGSPATFLAELRPLRSVNASEATLVIRELGRDRLARPQRIPLLIPPEGALTQPISTESYSFGTDSALLDGIAAAGGGRVLALADPGVLLVASPPRTDSRQLWPWLLPLAAACFLTALVLRRVGL